MSDGRGDPGGVPTSPVQLRIAFSGPTVPVAIELSLAGVVVVADAPDGHLDEVWQYLSTVGVQATLREGIGFSFPIGSLRQLADLPAQVQIRATGALRPLWALVAHPSADEVPATLTVDASGDLALRWYDGNTDFDEALSAEAAPALLSSELPFVATPDAWARLRDASTLPVLAGRARMGLDGYVELTAPVAPQLVEASPLPALFRIDETHFGVPLPFVDAISDHAGFVWDGPQPTIERGPTALPEMPVELSAHHRADLHQLVDRLAAFRAQAVVWQSGLGRRIFALAAIEALDAWPLLIVTPPSAVWAWQRNLELLGRSVALTHDRADAHIVTYRDLAARRRLPDPTAIIFDELTSAEATSERARAALHRLDGIMDAYRLATDRNWPENLTEATAAMSVLRPGEFRSGIPLAQRYPMRPEERAREHVEAYLSRRAADAPDTDPTFFRRSGVLSVEPNDAQVRALAGVLDRLPASNPQASLTEALEVVSAGTPDALSPKIAHAVELARRGVDAGRTVAVLTRYQRTATMVAASLRPTKVTQVDASAGAVEPANPVTVMRFSSTLPNLRGFGDVIVVDYPWSMEVLEAAVGGAADDRGPDRVTCLHAVGTIDDRLAIMAATRRELRGVTAPDTLPTEEEITYLLTPRTS